jgi:hypothetical protein
MPTANNHPLGENSPNLVTLESRYLGTKKCSYRLLDQNLGLFLIGLQFVNT